MLQGLFLYVDACTCQHAYPEEVQAGIRMEVLPGPVLWTEISAIQGGTQERYFVLTRR